MKTIICGCIRNAGDIQNTLTIEEGEVVRALGGGGRSGVVLFLA